MESESVKHISECFIKPCDNTENVKRTIHLTPSDLGLISIRYIQKGLVLRKPPLLSDAQECSSIQAFLDRLKQTRSLTLSHFYPLASRLATHKSQHAPSYVVYIDCINTPGARFVHSRVNLSVSDILSPTCVPRVVEHFFSHHEGDGEGDSIRDSIGDSITAMVTKMLD